MVQTLLPTFLAIATHGEASLTVRILLDPGSQISFCTERVVRFLRAPTITRNMTFVAMGNHVQETEEAARITIKSRFSPHEDVFLATVLKELTGVVHSVSYDPTRRFKTLQKNGVPMADTWPQTEGVSIDAIIGQDLCWQIMGLDFYELPEKEAKGLVFTDTEYGVIVQGSDRAGISKRPAAVSVLSNPLAVPGVKREKKTEPVLEALLRNFFSMESLGIREEVETTLNVRQQWATNFLKKHMAFDTEQKRFTVKIPFDEEAPELQKQLRSGFEEALWAGKTSSQSADQRSTLQGSNGEVPDFKPRGEIGEASDTPLGCLLHTTQWSVERDGGGSQIEDCI